MFLLVVPFPSIEDLTDDHIHRIERLLVREHGIADRQHQEYCVATNQTYIARPASMMLNNFFTRVPKHSGKNENGRIRDGSSADLYEDDIWDVPVHIWMPQRHGDAYVNPPLVDGRDLHIYTGTIPMSRRYWKGTLHEFYENVNNAVRRTVGIEALLAKQKETSSSMHLMNEFLYPTYTVLRALGYGPHELTI